MDIYLDAKKTSLLLPVDTVFKKNIFIDLLIAVIFLYQNCKNSYMY